MRIIVNESLDPYFNLAFEECLLEHTYTDIFMLWRNSPSVIIGKNQNAWAEVNTEFTSAHHIPVVRRLTGGGAVFHDPGNVNFTFITSAADIGGIDFAKFCEPVIDALSQLGISAEMSGRNDIMADGYKISGNAQCVHECNGGGKRLLHHGTLLYDADISRLAGALRVNSDKLKSKGIRSVSSRVKNIRDIGSLNLDSVGFMEHMIRCAESRYNSAAGGFTENEIIEANKLMREKYSTWEWNFGTSPEYEETRCARLNCGSVEISYTLRDGIVKSCAIRGDFFGTGDTEELECALTGCRFDKNAVMSVINDEMVNRVIEGANTADILSILRL